MLPAALTHPHHTRRCHSCHGNSLRATARQGQPAWAHACARSGPRPASHLHPSGPCSSPELPRGPSLVPHTSEQHRAQLRSHGRARLPGWHCAGACRKRNLGLAEFPSWPNVMHKGRAVPAAADAPSLPEPPAHDQPFGAGIFHSIPRQSDMLQCPGTLAAVTASAADTPEQHYVAWLAQSHGENLLQRALEEPSSERGLWDQGGASPSQGVLSSTLQRDCKEPN